ncbi:SUKH-4 family immunity protein [Streptomyces kunmingensis]|uniref:SUKH-4 family immunity protein n=1 Tax=Streptomyces kunmingensis TaxID=68225 RepID=A0ABU6C5F4_9ACTN|nr:SUKH-4 family immunity protein [Streptomyces kunmingensis]MEB3959947.1 SUKH-4 family immunity protein [Streptomyces kunmingensis]
MNFVVSPGEVRAAFGLTGVIYFPRHSAAHHQLDGRATLLLSSVGLPDTAWFMSRAGLHADDPVLLSERYAEGTVPEGSRDWLVLGMFADTPLALAPDTGTVYALGAGETQLSCTALHRDVESLVHSLTKFQILQQELEAGGDEDREGRVDALRAEITEFDPLPFASEDSQWHLTFEEVIDGIW